MLWRRFLFFSFYFINLFLFAFVFSSYVEKTFAKTKLQLPAKLGTISENIAIFLHITGSSLYPLHTTMLPLLFFSNNCRLSNYPPVHHKAFIRYIIVNSKNATDTITVTRFLNFNLELTSATIQPNIHDIASKTANSLL